MSSSLFCSVFNFVTSRLKATRYLHVQSDHGVVEDDSDAIVEKRLAEDEEVESHVDADFLENCKDSHLMIENC